MSRMFIEDTRVGSPNQILKLPHIELDFPIVQYTLRSPSLGRSLFKNKSPTDAKNFFNFHLLPTYFLLLNYFSLATLCNFFW